MIRYENECHECEVEPYRCIGESCPRKKVPHFYCDECGDDESKIYHFDNEELCIACIERRLDEVGI